MPKKTKKQKIVAEYRSKMKEQEIKENLINKDSSKEKKDFNMSEQEKSILEYTKKDLLKTIIVTGIILLLEFFIFFVNLKTS